MKYRQRWLHRRQLFNRPLPASLADWLYDPSSLTARLMRQCEQPFHVQLLAQFYGEIQAHEKRAMRLSGYHAGLHRTVLLKAGDLPLVYARTVIPVDTLRGSRRRYANLGERPLGAMLFADRSMRRGAVQISRLGSRECEWLCREYQVDLRDAGVWGRRSVFRVSQRPLLVSEYFLPALLAGRGDRQG